MNGSDDVVAAIVIYMACSSRVQEVDNQLSVAWLLRREKDATCNEQKGADPAQGSAIELDAPRTPLCGRLFGRWGCRRATVGHHGIMGCDQAPSGRLPVKTIL